MKKVFLLVYCLSLTIPIFSQISIDTDSPNDNITHLVNNVLLSSGVEASNFSYQGHPKQIGYFNGSNSNIGLDGGIVLSTGDISALDPNFTGFPEIVAQTPPIEDPDLLQIANSVPALIGQNFVVSSVNDVAIIEFDFVPSNDTITFNYVFGSQEYFGYENSTFNDVFGFFVSGPGINGPYSSPTGFPNGSINVALFESQEANSLGVDLPITVSSICNDPNDFGGPTVYNPQFFVNNQIFESVALIDGFTVSMTAQLIVQCGETYHIRISIGDGSDTGLSSFVFLEEKSFTSTLANISNNLDLEGSTIITNCGEEVTLTADVTPGDEFDYLWNTNETTQSISAGPGSYWVTATNDGCELRSDTITIDEDSLGLSLGDDLSVCSGDSILIGAEYINGEAPYLYDWNSGQTSAEIMAPSGSYSLTVTDANNCVGIDSITVNRLTRPTAEISGNGILCKGRESPEIEVNFTGVSPFLYSYTNGNQIYFDTTYTNPEVIVANVEGEYSILTIEDKNCEGFTYGNFNARRNDFNSVISGGGLICEGDSSEVIIQTDASLFPYSIYLNNGAETIRYVSTTNLFSMYSGGEYVFIVDKIVDSLGCESIDNSGVAPVLFKELKNINIITSIDSALCQVDSLVQLLATPEGGVWYGKGLDTENNFNPVNGYDGQNWLYYSFPQNCNETDSISIEVGCDVSLYIPNSFTPNGDYDNELLIYRGYNIIDFEFSVYSRWGEILFQTNDITEFWDGRFKGRVVQPGTYTYVAKIYGKDAKYKFQRGSINVLK